MTMDRPKPRDPAADEVTVRYNVLSPRVIAVWAVLILVVGGSVAVWLLLAYTGGDTDANRVQLDAIRTAGTIAVGTGGAAALLLAARRQRSAEIALKQKEQDQADTARAHILQERIAAETLAHHERVAAAAEADAAARRITDLYIRAVEQLGSDKTPVRHGGLYALERLAQDNPSQRQAIVNVVCAYLRMPYIPPGDPPADDADEQVQTIYRESVQEQQVRFTAQELLRTHLQPGDPAAPSDTFWRDIDLHLNGATLIAFRLRHCVVRWADFNGATFIRTAQFLSANFTHIADFGSATFKGFADFRGAAFGTELTASTAAAFR